MTRPPFTLEEVTDPTETARFRAQMDRFRRNSEWLQAHWEEVLPGAAGKYLTVAGQEAFLADTSEEAWARARAAHPEDDGALSQYIRPERGPRIYVHRRGMVAV